MRWHNRAHFFAVSAQMSGAYVDFARGRPLPKRDGGARRVTLDEAGRIAQATDDPDLLALDDALHRLAALDERKSRIVELKFFGGLSAEETAQVIGVAPVTVMREWGKAKAWLYRELSK